MTINRIILYTRKIILTYVFTWETVTARMMSYKNTNVMVHTSYGDTDGFDNDAGVLQKDILALSVSK